MIIVLDASTGIEIALDRGNASLYTSYLMDATKVITSDLYKAETSNVLWKYVKARFISKDRALQTYQFCEAIIDEFIDLSENAEESISESTRLNHSTYDLFYLTLARRHGAMLITLDKKLNEIALENGIETAKTTR